MLGGAEVACALAEQSTVGIAVKLAESCVKSAVGNGMSKFLYSHVENSVLKIYY